MAKIDISVVGGMYKHDSLPFDAQTCVNLYPEIGGRQSNSPSILRKAPGILKDTGKSRYIQSGVYSSLGATTFTSGIRGIYTTADQTLWICAGRYVMQYLPALDAFVFVPGFITFASTQVSFSQDNTNLVIADGTAMSYSVKNFYGNPTAITDPQCPVDSPMVETIDGYTFGFSPTAAYGVFAHSNLNDVTAWDDADSYTAEGSSDPLIAIKAVNKKLWLFGSETFEIWYNSGTGTRTWKLVPGTFTNIGCSAQWSVQSIAGRVLWLGGSKEGNNIIFMSQGYQALRVSNHALEKTIGNFTTVSDATAYTYQEDGHEFYVLTFPTEDKTYVYDMTTSEWHERAYRNTTTGALESQKGRYHAFYNGKNYVAGKDTDIIYDYSSSHYDDNTEAMYWERTFPYFSTQRRRIFWSSLELGIQTGVGLTGESAPKLQLCWSNDGGNIFGNWHEMSIGAIGEYFLRAKKNRLGYSHSQGRVYKIRGTDSVRIAIQDNAVAEVEIVD